MSLLTTMTPSSASRDRLDVRLNVGRTAGLLALAIAMLSAAAVLHGLDRETAAAWFTGIGEALLFGVLGLALGERSVAREAVSRLRA